MRVSNYIFALNGTNLPYLGLHSVHYPFFMVKRISMIFTTTLTACLLVIPAHSAVKAGSSCKKLGSISLTSTKKFTCVRLSKKLVWNKGVPLPSVAPKVQPAPTPSPTPTPAPAPKPAPTPTPAPVSLPQSFEDRPDEVDGFQLKVIYVVPSDRDSRKLDTDGTIERILNEGNSFLESEINRRISIDTYGGKYDIQFFKTKMSKQELFTSVELHKKLLAEMNISMTDNRNRKLYSFWVDVDAFSSGTACGYTGINAISNVVAVGPQCSQQSAQFPDNRVTAWIHEAIHNFGVIDTNGDGCEFLSHEECTSKIYRIDPFRKYYVGTSSYAGSDLLLRRVWIGNINDQSLTMRCADISNEFEYVCSVGRALIGPPRYQWTNFGTAHLFEINGQEKILRGIGEKSSKPWGAEEEYSCGSGYTCPSAELTELQIGLKTYAWFIDGIKGDEFRIYWKK